MFPERQVIVRTEGRVFFAHVSRLRQITLVVALAVLGAWTTYSSVKVVLHEKILLAKEQDIRETRNAYWSLLSDISDYQRRISTITNNLEENHAVMLGLVEQNTSLQKDLRRVEDKLITSETERSEIVKNREVLKNEMLKIEQQMQALLGREFPLRDDLSSTEDHLQQVLLQRNQALSQNAQGRRKIQELENLIGELNDIHLENAERLTDFTQDNIDHLEGLVAATGLNVDSVLSAVAPEGAGQGGPFIAAETTDSEDPEALLKVRLSNLDILIDRVEILHGVIRRIPLIAPTNSGYISSSFGKRRDPFNGKWAMHYGIDFGGPKNSPVYSTAPGTVVYAGKKARYGRVVEIDHGAGLRTLYGHLNKTLVKKGDLVDHHHKIGLMGNTGRSTGTHLHYEIRLNGRPLNPIKFITTGRNVFKG